MVCRRANGIGIDRWILWRLGRIEAEVLQAYERHEFHAVCQKLAQFATVDLSAIYHDAVKDRLYTLAARHPKRRAAQTGSSSFGVATEPTLVAHSGIHCGRGLGTSAGRKIGGFGASFAISADGFVAWQRGARAMGEIVFASRPSAVGLGSQTTFQRDRQAFGGGRSDSDGRLRCIGAGWLGRRLARSPQRFAANFCFREVRKRTRIQQMLARCRRSGRCASFCGRIFGHAPLRALLALGIRPRSRFIPSGLVFPLHRGGCAKHFPAGPINRERERRFEEEASQLAAKIEIDGNFDLTLSAWESYDSS